MSLSHLRMQAQTTIAVVLIIKAAVIFQIRLLHIRFAIMSKLHGVKFHDAMQS